LIPFADEIVGMLAIVVDEIGGQNIETEISRDKISRDINIEVKNIERLKYRGT